MGRGGGGAKRTQCEWGRGGEEVVACTTRTQIVGGFRYG